MRLCVVVSFVLMASCANESRHFRGVDPVRIAVDGSNFDVRLRGTLAEAVRTNPEYAPRLGPLRARAGFAMAQVSGCEVTGILGDQALMTGILDCGGSAAEEVLPSYGCKDVQTWLRKDSAEGYPVYICSP